MAGLVGGTGGDSTKYLEEPVVFRSKGSSVLREGKPSHRSPVYTHRTLDKRSVEDCWNPYGGGVCGGRGVPSTSQTRLLEENKTVGRVDWVDSSESVVPVGLLRDSRSK